MKNIVKGRRSTRLRAMRGSAIAEFALILPVVMLICAGIVEFGSLFEVYTATNELASQYALSWADCSDNPTGTCQTEMNNYASSYSIGNVVPELTSANLTLQMFEVTMQGSTPTIVYSSPANAQLTAAQTAAAQANFSAGQTGVIVTASYVHTLKFFSTIMSPFLGNALTPSYTVAQLKT